MKTEILNIFVCSDKGNPMCSLEYVEALAGRGLAGDRYALGTGSYSKDEPLKKQVTFIATEGIESANNQLETPFLAEETRRNIVTKNVDLNSLVGKHFKIGRVVFKGTELCPPCKRPSVLAKKEKFKEAFENQGGLRAEVISGGMLTIGEMTFQVIE